MNAEPKSFWRDRLEVPAYRVGEAASYARVSASTVTRWERVRSGRDRVLKTRTSKQPLSFLQLIEMAVVAELRREGVKLDAIGRARDWFSAKLSSNYPFALEEFKSDGVNVLQDYVDDKGEVVPDRLVAIDEGGQLVWREFLRSRLREFGYSNGIAARWHVNGTESKVVIDPRLSFGSPTVCGIMTRSIKNEWVTGNSIFEISEDFDLDPQLVREALEFEGILIEDTRSLQ